MIGESLGPYRILEPLGAGGMGEVYLGEDTRLGRKVAIKVLPPEFASDPERLARFEQEARAAAALNHPHIAVVHDVGSEEGKDGTVTHFMVQEYLEGQSLRQRLDQGALPLDNALGLAIEIDEALVAAHKAGIVHRDLKPDNIFVTEEGHAKVLDFGLAKLTEIAAPAGSSASMSPTMLGTVAGQVMGTAGFMAPEQINGDEVDGRADLFAFGCVLYAMVTGRQAFSGKNVHDTLGQILSEEPEPVSTIDPSLPADLQRIVRKALAKDLKRRYQSAADLNADLLQLREDVTTGVASPAAAALGAAPASAAPQPRANPLWTAIPMAILALAVGIAATRWSMQPAPGRVARFSVALPAGEPFAGNGRRMVAISPDGSRIIFVAGQWNLDDGGQLWMRHVDAEGLTPVPNTQHARSPFFSPGGDRIGFFAKGRLMSVPTSGGAAVDLGPAADGTSPHWADNGMIYFGRANMGIWQVPETGGTPEVVVAMEEGERADGPQLLPGGEWLLFSRTNVRRRPGWSSADIVVQRLDSDVREVVHSSGADARVLSTGHLVYWVNGSLYSLPFDATSRSVSGLPVEVVPGVLDSAAAGSGAAQYAISQTGTLIYVAGDVGTPGREPARLVWADRDGNVEPTRLPVRSFGPPRISPDGRSIAVEEQLEESTHIWVYDVGRGSGQQLAGDEFDNRRAVWSPDSAWIYYQSRDETGAQKILKKRADLSGAAELVLEKEGVELHPWSISSDGSRLLFTEIQGGADIDIGMLRLDEPGSAAELLVDTPGTTNRPSISPDGRSLAFTSTESGAIQVVAMNIESRSRAVVSPGGSGQNPRWSASGNEIFYLDQRTIYSVSVAADPGFEIGVPQALVTGVRFAYDVSADGQRFLHSQLVDPETDQVTSAANELHVVLNWFDELKQRVPTIHRD